VSAILKSLATAVLGASLFFCFFMLLSGPVLIIAARLHHQDAMYVAPLPLFRMVGLPLSAVAFLLCFVLAMRKFRKNSSQPSALSRQ
jgi:hypothetical protein